MRKTPQCVDCIYFFHHDYDNEELDQGTCHRYPPTVTYVADANMDVISFVHTDWTHWCGEFVRRRSLILLNPFRYFTRLLVERNTAYQKRERTLNERSL